MKVLLINGSRREKGCTYTALCEAASVLNENGIETEIFYVGADSVNGNINAIVKEVGAACADADGIIIGSPVYYASPSGEVMAFLDRLFMAHGAALAHKPGAAVVSARRGGTTATFDALNKYFTINQMPIVSSTYWNMVHGNSPEEVKRDEEGMQTMRILGENMAWLLKCIEAGKANGISIPETSAKIKTNFIR